VRGRFNFGLTAETLLPLRVSDGGDVVEWFRAVLSAPDILAAAKCVVGIVIDALPAAGRSGGEQAAMDISVIEAVAWQRYLRLANLTFRRSHMGDGAVVGYFGVRRMEIANLITLSESIRLGIDERETRARMIPRTDLEVAHV
jgi:vacuolar-type H+-ATPase subunit C/Vma6